MSPPPINCPRRKKEKEEEERRRKKGKRGKGEKQEGCFWDIIWRDRGSINAPMAQTTRTKVNKFGIHFRLHLQRQLRQLAKFVNYRNKTEENVFKFTVVYSQKYSHFGSIYRENDNFRVHSFPKVVSNREGSLFCHPFCWLTRASRVLPR